MQKLEEARQQEGIQADIEVTKVESFVINPNIDYDRVTDVISQIEGQFNTPDESALIQPPHLPSMDETWSTIREANPKAFDTMTDVGKIGHQHITITKEALRDGVISYDEVDKVVRIAPGQSIRSGFAQMVDTPALQLELPQYGHMPVATKVNQGEVVTVKPLPPISDDFLAFLIEKHPKSFGWIVDPTFFTNFGCTPESYTEKDPFIFWIVPAPINIFKTATSGGFQRSETRSYKTHPHIFLIKLLEIKEGDAEADPFIEIINSAAYLKLRESLEARGIEFLYDYNPSRLWMNGLKDRLNNG